MEAMRAAEATDCFMGDILILKMKLEMWMQERGTEAGRTNL